MTLSVKPGQHVNSSRRACNRRMHQNPAENDFPFCRSLPPPHFFNVCFEYPALYDHTPHILHGHFRTLVYTNCIPLVEIFDTEMLGIDLGCRKQGSRRCPLLMNKPRVTSIEPLGTPGALCYLILLSCGFSQHTYKEAGIPTPLFSSRSFQ